MVFNVNGPCGRFRSISLRCGHDTKLGTPATLGNLRTKIFEQFGVPPFEQHLELRDGEVLKGDENNPLDAPFLKLEPALKRPMHLSLSTRTDPRHAAEKTAAFIECLTSTPPKLKLALHMLKYPSGVPIDPNCKTTIYLYRDETCVYGSSRATLPPLTFALWAEPLTVDVVPVVEELLAQGADPNLTGNEEVSDGSGMGGCRSRGTLTDISPLCHAVQRGSAECVLRLLAAGADPNAHSGSLGREGGLPEAFYGRSLGVYKLKGPNVPADINALLDAARKFHSAHTDSLAEGRADKLSKLSKELHSLLKNRKAAKKEQNVEKSQKGDRKIPSNRKVWR
eukprot:CAMPEP_0118662726 /NCGR_PEP_ID=MMETSP0785-20121206/16995_1 /TAXON_ID=91992 /ORGANISM="Bolidomonas pacifica, Strain CCMP 1866" /LENGTH=337 /DNA_ID=CAMNT_0006556309 /DNA_START=104 /DNA_END=1117 /DNA_ORIENTATION=-